jgi:quinolinate synthase
MAMNELQNLYASLASGSNEVQVNPEIARQALVPLERMVSFANSDAYRLRRATLGQPGPGL